MKATAAKKRPQSRKTQVKKSSKTIEWSSLILKLTGTGIVASGCTTAAMPGLREYMIPVFALCVSVFAITLFANLTRQEKTLEVLPVTKTKKKVKVVTSSELMESFEGDDSHLILCSTPYFSTQAKISPKEGVTPNSVIQCQANAETRPDQKKPVMRFSWRNADTGAFLGTRKKLDLAATFVRPGQSVECLVTAEDQDGDMATSLASVQIEANLNESETPTELFHIPRERQSRPTSNKRRRHSDNTGKQTTRTESPITSKRRAPVNRGPMDSRQKETRRNRERLVKAMEAEETSSAFYRVNQNVWE